MKNAALFLSLCLGLLILTLPAEESVTIHQEDLQKALDFIHQRESKFIDAVDETESHLPDRLDQLHQDIINKVDSMVSDIRTRTKTEREVTTELTLWKHMLFSETIRHEAIQKRKANDKEGYAQATAELHENIKTVFDTKLELSEIRVKSLEKEIQKLHSSIKKAKENQDRIIGGRLRLLLDDASVYDLSRPPNEE